MAATTTGTAPTTTSTVSTAATAATTSSSSTTTTSTATASSTAKDSSKKGRFQLLLQQFLEQHYSQEDVTKLMEELNKVDLRSHIDSDLYIINAL